MKLIAAVNPGKDRKSILSTEALTENPGQEPDIPRSKGMSPKEACPAGLEVPLQTVIDAIPETLIVIDRSYRIVLANRTARASAGDQDPVHSGMTCYTFSHHRKEPCGGTREPCPFDEVIRTGKPATATHIHFDSKGNKQYVQVNAAPIFDRSGRVSHIVEAHRNTTERKKAEEALKALNETLENRVKERTRKLERNAVQLRALASELTRAEQRERKRLAEYLHDHLQQLLVGVRMGVESLKNPKRTDESINRNLKVIEESIEQAIEASRSLTFELSP
ncbi:MAG: PAS domain-containing protein, partial [Planctomycetes bacterium]|nr:PAS domain-containing protein [Planctomycetota bacterium]